MKITCEVEATPREVRELIGLPDMQPVWEKAQDQLQERIKAPEFDNLFDPFGFRKIFDGAFERSLPSAKDQVKQ
ncbi:DUF6489 family protein [Neptuniibacter sp. QD37_11]|uniref:DUF6489 family protein n=1 Tax=Neptuniibacter sp. QD37_11 TaxID=3398209 RepID=UPI0039F5781E